MSNDTTQVPTKHPETQMTNQERLSNLERKKPVINWVADKLAAPIIMLLLGTYFGWWWNSSAPYLRFSLGEVIQFSGEKEEFGLFVMRITNDGGKRAEQVRCEIELNDSRIQDLKAGPSILEPNVKIEGDGKKATITIPTLNSAEVVELAIKASKPDQISKSRRISVRGNDVVGIEGTRSPTPGFAVPLMALIFVIVLFFATVSWMLLDIVGSNEKVRHYVDRRRPKKTFRFRDGPFKGKVISGDEANKLYDSMRMRGTRLEVDGVRYNIRERTIDDDGTLELLMWTL
ncbi:MAG: hypothetical protein IAG10_32090 [Planctomycetaceae bacterium]|nr:hypothetical protein [Planctomycetaceae bacterium]